MTTKFTLKMNIRNIISVCVICAVSCLVPVAMSAKTKTIKIGNDVTKIVNYTSADVHYSNGNPRVELIGSEEALKHIRLIVSGGSVVLQPVEDSSRKQLDSDVSVNVYGTNIKNFISYGSGDFHAQRMDAPNVTLASYGSGDISVASVEGSGLQISIFGSGDIKVTTSKATSLTVFVQGSGDATVNSTSGASVQLSLQGSGDISMPAVTASSLRVVNSGSGDISVGGNVNSVTFVSEGSGDIHGKSLKAKKVTKIHQGSGDIDD